MADNIVTSFGALNYSGMLFNKGNTRTPFSTLIGGSQKTTNHVEFATGVEYTTIGGEQPAITETASLTAPDSTFLTRAQKTNVTQIFQEALGISYAKESNMDNLSGINVAGQTANPPTELDFQVAARMNKIARDIEYTFIRGVYNKATTDGTANKTRGMISAIETNSIDLEGKPLRVWDIASILEKIHKSQGSTNGLVLWVDPVSLFQLNADAEQNGNTIVPASRSVNGISISSLLTPMGEIGVYLGEFLPAGTVGIFNPQVISVVQQPHPTKGNFFLEKLAKVGAGTKYQIFGQVGLDHGPEWFHGKIENISTNFEKPEPGKRIYAAGGIPTIEVLPELKSVKLAGAVHDTATAALELAYIGKPDSTTLVLAYQWEIAANSFGPYTNIANATSATYTPLEADIDKYIRCKVTASIAATGTVVSNAKKVLAE